MSSTNQNKVNQNNKTMAKSSKCSDCKECRKLRKALEKAIYELQTSKGAWCIDHNPKFETLKNIRENCWRFMPKIPKMPARSGFQSE